MAYAKRYGAGFVDLPTQTTAIDSTFLNAVEAALLKVFDTDPTVDGQVAQWISASSKYGPALLLNKNVDPAAAIAKSKIDLTGGNGIVNADVAGAAAIALTKLASSGTIGTSPVSVGAAGKTAIGIADSGAQLSGITIGGDTNLYRLAGTVLKTDGRLVTTEASWGFHYNPAAIGGYALYSSVAAEANPRFAVDAVGKAYWGPGGASAVDMSLYRRSAGILTVGLAAIEVERAASGSYAYRTLVSGDGGIRFAIEAGGIVRWGDGTAAQDTDLFREGAALLKTTGRITSSSTSIAFRHNPASASGYALYVDIVGDTNPRFTINNTGILNWGPGNAGLDTSLYRSAANTLTTDGSLLVAGVLLKLGSMTVPAGPSNWLAIGNTGAVPGTPTGGGVIWTEGGALKYKGTSGTITTIAVA